MARLIMCRGERTQEYDIEGNVTLGRASANTIRVPEANASRRHAQIASTHEGFVLEDLKSSNGTYVNDARITRHVLCERDVIRIGKTEFTFTMAMDDPHVGRQLGGYVLKRRLGQGGMGMVYLAWQQSMERDVALKLLAPRFTEQPDFVARFQEEARLAGRLNHRNVIGVHDFGQGEGQSFFSMEYVRGEDLQNRLDRSGALPPETCIALGQQIAAGLLHAHEMGILHQDIKPLNIMLTEKDVVKIADLGLARSVHYGNDEETGQQKLVGTPTYMAPEVLRKQTPDIRSDIFSFGATLYYMATGRPPTSGESTREIIKQRLDGQLVDPQQITSNLPRPLTELILRLMDRSPENRPNDMRAVLEQLQTVAMSLKNPPTPVPPSGRMKSSVQTLPVKNRWQPKQILLAAAAIALPLALLAYVVGSGPSDAEQAKKLLTYAQRQHRRGRPSNALKAVKRLLKRYPTAPSAEAARDLRKRLKQALAINRLSEDWKAGRLSAAKMRSALEGQRKELAPGPLLDRVEELLAELDRLEERKTAAVEKVTTKPSPTASSPSAQASETAMNQQAAKRVAQTRFAQGLAEAMALAKSGKQAEAWKAYAELLVREDRPNRRGQVIRALQALESPIRKRLYRFQNDVRRCGGSLQVGDLTKRLEQTAESLKGLPWQRTALRLSAAAQAIEAYRLGLGRSIESRLNSHFKTGVKGRVGMHRLSLDADENLLLIDRRGRSISAPWTDLHDDTLWTLAPAVRLGLEECFGASMHMLARRHYGYVRSYLPGAAKVPVGDPSRLIGAMRSGRMLMEVFDFSSYLQSLAWRGVDGRFAMKQGAFCPTTPKATVQYQEGILSGRNSCVGWILQGTTAGVFAIHLDAGERGRAGVRIVNGQARLSVFEGLSTRGQSGQDVVYKVGQSLRLFVQNKKAFLLLGRTRSELPWTVAGQHPMILRLAFENFAGRLDTLWIEQAP